MEITAKDIAEQITGVVEGDAQILVRGVARIEQGKPNYLCFLANPKYEHYIYTTKASVVLVNNTFQPSQRVEATLIRVEDAYQGIAQVLSLFSDAQRKKGRERHVTIGRKVKMGKNVYLGACSYIGRGCVIADGVQIYPQVYIGDNVEIGANTVLYSGVRIYKGCKLGSNCTIHSNTVIGSDGFGFAPCEDGSYKKIPQTGIVTIMDNVEIGANTVIDRSTMGTTLIGKGVKLDNLIQIAHNVEIGENTVIAAQSGVAGSSKIGKHCMLGGQVGVSGHLYIADGVQLCAQSGVIGSIKEENAILSGTPAIDHKENYRAFALYRKAAKKS